MSEPTLPGGSDDRHGRGTRSNPLPARRRLGLGECRAGSESPGEYLRAYPYRRASIIGNEGPVAGRSRAPRIVPQMKPTEDCELRPCGARRNAALGRSAGSGRARLDWNGQWIALARHAAESTAASPKRQSVKLADSVASLLRSRYRHAGADGGPRSRTSQAALPAQSVLVHRRRCRCRHYVTQIAVTPRSRASSAPPRRSGSEHAKSAGAIGNHRLQELRMSPGALNRTTGQRRGHRHRHGPVDAGEADRAGSRWRAWNAFWTASTMSLGDNARTAPDLIRPLQCDERASIASN